MQKLGEAVDLVVVCGVREGEDFGKEVGQPRSLARQENLACLELCGLCGQAVLFVSSRHDPNDRGTAGFKLLQERLPDPDLFDENDVGGKVPGLAANPALQIGKHKPSPSYVEHVENICPLEAGDADRVSVAIVCSARDVPALHDHVAPLLDWRKLIAPEPSPLDHVAALWHGVLLILRVELWAADVALDFF